MADQRRLMLEQISAARADQPPDATLPEPAVDLPEPTLVSQPVAPVTPQPAAAPKPQPAAGSKADQFRKLRRDAKRRAIGV